MTLKDLLHTESPPVDEEEVAKTEEDNEDIVHEALGGIGKYQLIINGLLSIVSISVSWQMLSMNFLAADTDFWCSEVSEDPEAASRWHPTKDDDSVNWCKIYDLDYDGVGNLSELTITPETPVRSCSKFSYDTSVWTRTVAQQFDLVCDRKTWIAYANAIFMSGVTVGVYISGIISDHIGRKPTLFGLLVLSVASGTSAAFVDNFKLWMGLRWICYACTMSLQTVRFILGQEMMSGRKRGMYGSLFFLVYVFGIIAYPGIVAMLMDSFKIQLVISLFNAPVLLILLYVPESPRWLIGKGRFDEATKILEYGAKVNGRRMPTNLKYHPKSEDEKRINVFSLFKTPKLRLYTLGMYILWFGHGFVYYGIGLNIGNIGGNLFTNLMIFGLVDIPAFLLSSWTMMKCRRKIVIFPMMMMTAISLMATMFFEKGVYPGDWPIVTLAMTAKFCLGLTFTSIYSYGVEVFPTIVRNVGMGSSSSWARIGSILAPLTFSLSYINPKFFPTGLLGLVFLGCAFCFLILPETLGDPLLRTIEDLETRAHGRSTFGKDSWLSNKQRKQRESANKC